MTGLLAALGLVAALVRRWWRDAVTDRVAWLVEDLRGSDTSPFDDDTAHWLAPYRHKIGSSR
jgi:hypothetical protein